MYLPCHSLRGLLVLPLLVTGLLAAAESEELEVVSLRNGRTIVGTVNPEQTAIVVRYTTVGNQFIEVLGVKLSIKAKDVIARRPLQESDLQAIAVVDKRTADRLHQQQQLREQAEATWRQEQEARSRRAAAETATKAEADAQAAERAQILAQVQARVDAMVAQQQKKIDDHLRTLVPQPQLQPPVPAAPGSDVLAQVVQTILSAGRGASLRIVAADGTFLGNCAQMDVDSIFNQYGLKGSPYGVESMNNQFSLYGSEYGPNSPNNSYSPTPPRLLFEGRVLGYLSNNSVIIPRISLNYLKALGGR